MNWSRATCLAGGLVVTMSATPAVAQQKAPTEQELKAKGARLILNDEVRAMLVGHTWYFLHIASQTVIPIYYRDERSRVSIVQGRKRITNWWTEGADRTCNDSIVTTGHRCQTTYLLNKQFHICIERERTCDYIVRSVPGNPEGL